MSIIPKILKTPKQTKTARTTTAPQVQSTSDRWETPGNAFVAGTNAISRCGKTPCSDQRCSNNVKNSLHERIEPAQVKLLRVIELLLFY
ncbi:MAG: hypothetical protein QW708_03735 [Desulfurococcaceae archaeon]